MAPKTKEKAEYIARVKGDHHRFKHTSNKGTVTVPHPKKNIPVKTVKSIFKQAGIQIK
ncbi:HicA toxin of toxin-antitoxin [Anaerovirgula multivorans]|uniref:HicA toxin of toxin-antitoxin n=1 Tax=Anaerovirgula multivorans TaxID=312168 RepID=A0A239HVM3_9FIRM|nr:type II toxin-antitoxin system HicA family toxin [Anaerovirgula multivorans]SNS85367.1 HicA toxin of toxin-antitoxin [Anaerovirgula multivorans]